MKPTDRIWDLKQSVRVLSDRLAVSLIGWTPCLPPLVQLGCQSNVPQWLSEADKLGGGVPEASERTRDTSRVLLL